MKNILKILAMLIIISGIIYDINKPKLNEKAYFEYANRQSLLLRGYEINELTK